MPEQQSPKPVALYDTFAMKAALDEAVVKVACKHTVRPCTFKSSVSQKDLLDLFVACKFISGLLSALSLLWRSISSLPITL